MLRRQWKLGHIREGVLGMFVDQKGFTEIMLEYIRYLPSWKTACMLKKYPEGPVSAALSNSNILGAWWK